MSPNGFNRFMYTEGNPVRWRDPNGNSGSPNLLAAMTGGLKLAAAGISGGIRTAGTNIGNGAKFLGKEYEYAKKKNEEAENVNTFINGGEEGALAFFVLNGLARNIGKAKARNTFFGHKYTGDGNRDYYSKFFDSEKNNKSVTQIAFEFIASNIFHIDENYQKAFINIIPGLRVNPKSFADRLAQRHDSEVYGQTFSTSKNRSAGAHYYKAWGDGFLRGDGGFWEQPIDSIIVGGGGSIIFLIEDLSFNINLRDDFSFSGFTP